MATGGRQPAATLSALELALPAPPTCGAADGPTFHTGSTTTPSAAAVPAAVLASSPAAASAATNPGLGRVMDHPDAKSGVLHRHNPGRLVSHL